MAIRSPEWLEVAKATVIAQALLNIPAKAILLLKALSTSSYVDLPIGYTPVLTMVTKPSWSQVILQN